MKEESEKVGLKFNIQKTKIMTTCPISSWQIDMETLEVVRDILCVCVLQNHCKLYSAAMILKDAYSWEGNL